MNWEIVKEQAQKWYGRAGQFFLFQNFVLYLFACVAAHGAVGPTALHPLSQSLLPVGGTVSDGQPDRLFAFYGRRRKCRGEPSTRTTATIASPGGNRAKPHVLPEATGTRRP